MTAERKDDARPPTVPDSTQQDEDTPMLALTSDGNLTTEGKREVRRVKGERNGKQQEKKPAKRLKPKDESKRTAPYRCTAEVATLQNIWRALQGEHVSGFFVY